MKISEYNLSLQTSHERSQQSSVKETLRVWVDRAASAGQAASERITISEAARHRQTEEAAGASDSAADSSNDPKLRMLIFLVEKLTGLKVRVFDGRELNASARAEMPEAPPAEAGPPPVPRAGFGVAYDRVESYSESEQTTFEASGVIKTSDGKEIKFSLNLAMQRQYSETSTTSIRMGDATRKTDPLVINFDGTAAQLGEQRFAFDLNADGSNEQVNFVGSGSGFLALDLNGDGKVNDGKELFGPATGNGFNELARHDADGNGWIDESGPVFSRLKVWTRDGAGADSLKSLSALGVGAISLHAVATPFDIKTAGNQLLGSVVASSVYLKEDGSAGSVQQVDLTA